MALLLCCILLRYVIIIHCVNNFNKTDFYYQIESLSNFLYILFYPISEIKFSIPNNPIHYFSQKVTRRKKFSSDCKNN